MLLNVEKLVYGGDGLARLPADEHGSGKAVFLPFVLEGEEVEASLLEQKRGFARARCEKIVRTSPQRVDPQCPYFERCGGCHYQHAGYDHQLQIKAAILKENLRRLARIELSAELAVHASPPWNYRNRVRLQVRRQPALEVGYYRWNSHALQPVTQCPIASPLIQRAIATLSQQKTSGWAASAEEIELFANAEDSQLLVEVACGPKTPASQAIQAAEELKSVLTEATGVVMRRSGAPGGPGKQIALVGSGELTYKVGAQSYRVSAGAFFQVNRYLIPKLVELVTDDLSGDCALDLYAGVGLFSSELSRSFAQVTAVESSPTSHSDLAYNSLPKVKAVRATTEQFLGSAGKLRPDVVVVDPPRSGLGEMVVRSLAGLGARRMVYVSCDPATASRDLAGLLSAGYRFQHAELVDLFPQTYHIESVFHLVR